MSLAEKDYTALLEALVADFTRRMIAVPDFMPDIPANAHVVIQIASDSAQPGEMQADVLSFNAWSLSVGKRQREHGQPLCIATCRLAPMLTIAKPILAIDTIASSPNTYELQPC